MLKEVKIADLQENVFHKIGKEWMLITAGDNDKANAMTASWGSMGVLWNKNIVTIFIRPQRHTKLFLDNHTHFSCCYFEEEQRSMLAYMGKASGKDEDKIAHSNLHVAYDEAPYFTEAKQVFICKKLYHQEIDPTGFLDQSIDTKNYPEKDYHIMYVGEIIKVLEK